MILLNAQQLAVRKHVAGRREIAEEGDDLAQHVGAVAGECAADIDDVVDGLRRLIVVKGKCRCRQPVRQVLGVSVN